MKNLAWEMHDCICFQAKNQFFFKFFVIGKLVVQSYYSFCGSYFSFQRQISLKEDAIETLASRISEKAVDFQHTIEELECKLEEVAPTSSFQEVGNMHYLKDADSNLHSCVKRNISFH